MLNAPFSYTGTRSEVQGCPPRPRGVGVNTPNAIAPIVCARSPPLDVAQTFLQGSLWLKKPTIAPELTKSVQTALSKPTRKQRKGGQGKTRRSTARTRHPRQPQSQSDSTPRSSTTTSVGSPLQKTTCSGVNAGDSHSPADVPTTSQDLGDAIALAWQLQERPGAGAADLLPPHPVLTPLSPPSPRTGVETPPEMLAADDVTSTQLGSAGCPSTGEFFISSLLPSVNDLPALNLLGQPQCIEDEGSPFLPMTPNTEPSPRTPDTSFDRLYDQTEGILQGLVCEGPYNEAAMNAFNSFCDGLELKGTESACHQPQQQHTTSPCGPSSVPSVTDKYKYSDRSPKERAAIASLQRDIDRHTQM